MKSWKPKPWKGGSSPQDHYMEYWGGITLHIYFFTCIGIVYSFSCSLIIQNSETDVECFACEYTQTQLLDDVKS